MTADVATAPDDARVRPMLRGILECALAGAPWVASGLLYTANVTADSLRSPFMPPMADYRVGVHVLGANTDLAATRFAFTHDVSTASNLTEYALGSGGLTNLQVSKAIERLFEVAHEERFEHGVDSNLALGIAAVISRFPREAMRSLREKLASSVSRAVVVEALEAIGRVEHLASVGERMALLVAFLKDPSPFIRDAAATGLSYLMDSRAIPYLRAAIERETNRSLREDMEAVIVDLRRDGARTA